MTTETNNTTTPYDGFESMVTEVTYSSRTTTTTNPCTHSLRCADGLCIAIAKRTETHEVHEPIHYGFLRGFPARITILNIICYSGEPGLTAMIEISDDGCRSWQRDAYLDHAKTRAWLRDSGYRLAPR